MSNSFFKFKQFTIQQDQTAMKVTTDSCLFGAWAAKEMQSLKNTSNLLDIGTGTGLLSLMIAQKNDVEIDAVEIDEKAAAQAKENIIKSPWNKRIRLLQEDILGLEDDKQYSLIISNPPFYENELNSPNREKNIAHHSEQLNLRQLFHIIKKSLLPTGEFFLLIPAKREKDFESLCADYGAHITNRIIVKQSANHRPFRLMVHGSFFIQPTTEAGISIKDEHNEYTSEFKELLKDYYLYLGV